jgi:amino acid transporter
LAAILIINIFGTMGYAEEEFWASLLKLSATVVFLIVAVVLVCGGGPKSGDYGEYWGARLWYDPGAFQNGFRGFCGKSTPLLSSPPIFMQGSVETKY